MVRQKITYNLIKEFIIKYSFSILLAITSISAQASYKAIPTNLDSLSMWCATWEAQPEGSINAAIDDFSISERIEGVRILTPNYGNKSFQCAQNAIGLLCEGDLTVKIRIKIQLDYSKHTGNLIEGYGKLSSTRKLPLFCELSGDVEY